MAYTTIKKSSDYFNTKLYTGNGSTNAITGVGFQPDWVWIKDRDTSQHHRLADVVRGVKKNLRSDTTDVENTTDSNNGLQSFDSDGFTLTQDSNDHGYNANGSSQVSWNWKANGAGSANTQGDIASTVSASATSGFSIVSWTSLASGSNYTVGHGLGSTPAMIIMKGRHESNSWIVYHHKNTSAPETEYLELNSTAATADYTVWNDTAPTNSFFTCGTWSGFDNGGTMIAYCFNEVQGYSKFGSYTGNGSADGTFVYTGFKPAFVMTKKTSGTSQWVMFDNKRSPINYVQRRLQANNAAAENTDDNQDFDILSNGFKSRRAAGDWNSSGDTFIYMAFAENPFVTSTAIPACAR